MKQLPIAIVLVLMLMPASRPTLACSTCMVGDPTQSLMGAEKPYEERFRISVDYLSRSEEIGREGFNLKTINENRLSLNLAYAPSTRWMLGASLPFVDRDLETFNLSDQSVSAVGDISLSAKSYWQEEESFQRHMYGFLGGIKLPTASEEKDADGEPLDFDVQAGQGATVINAGLWHAWFRYPWLVYSSASYHVAGEGFQDFQAGDAITFNSTLQYAPSQTLAWYLGVEGRYSETDQFDGIDDPDSGGTVLFLTPGLIYTLKTDWLLNVVFKYPALNDLDGDHEENAIISFGIIHDLHIH